MAKRMQNQAGGQTVGACCVLRRTFSACGRCGAGAAMPARPVPFVRGQFGTADAGGRHRE